MGIGRGPRLVEVQAKQSSTEFRLLCQCGVPAFHGDETGSCQWMGTLIGTKTEVVIYLDRDGFAGELERKGVDERIKELPKVCVCRVLVKIARYGPWELAGARWQAGGGIRPGV